MKNKFLRVEALVIAFAIIISFLSYLEKTADAASGPTTKNGQTTFYYQGTESTGNVFLVGDFNNWNVLATELHKDSNNLFTVSTWLLWIQICSRRNLESRRCRQ